MASRLNGIRQATQGNASGFMGHTDPTEIIRNMMVSLSPDMRNQLLKEFM